MCWLFIFGGVFILWAVFIIRFMHKMIFKQFKYLEKRDPNIEERFKPFERIDRDKWNIMEIYFCAVFLLPIRLLTIIGSMVVLIASFNLIVGTKRTTHHVEYPLMKRFMMRLLNASIGRLILWCFGFYYIEKKHLQISDYDKDYPLSNNLRKDRAPIIVSNHVSFLDIIYHTYSQQFSSFLSKVEVIQIPLFGAAACAFQCIFVDRNSRDDKDSVKVGLQERAKLIKEGKQFASTIIFPEGTTSNGQSLISFKKGAFESLLPVKIICIQYPIRHLNVTLDFLGQPTNILLGLCQLKNNLKILEFNTFYPEYLNLSEENENDWMIYARKIKDIMLKAMPHTTNSESGFRDMKEYESIMKEKKQKQYNPSSETKKEQ